MKNIILIIGARPNFMKAFPVYEALKEDFKLTLIHTGQHFDEKMSKVFFDELKFPHPDIHLSLTKKTKAGDFDNKLYINNKDFLKDKDVAIKELSNYKDDLGQLGEIRDKLKLEFEKIKPDLVIVFGDVTSTLAAGLSARLLDIELAHVESGLRSGDMAMPEEVNRILTDHITTYYFVTEQSGVDNLKKINKTENVYLVGNTMIDTQKKYLQQALDTKYYEILKVNPKEYVLITLHRPSNVDNLDKLKEIFDDFEKLSKTEILVYPIHPRTKNNLKKLGYLQKVIDNKNIILDEPLGYLEFTCLMAKCKYLITDSGGLQEESTSLDIPCFTLRENTERPSTLIENNGTNQLISKISDIKLKECKGSMELWDGESSKKIYVYVWNLFKVIINQFQSNFCFLIPYMKSTDIDRETNIECCLYFLKKDFPNNNIYISELTEDYKTKSMYNSKNIIHHKFFYKKDYPRFIFNRGFAVNAIYKKIEEDYIILIDSDIIIETPKCIYSVIKYMKLNNINIINPCKYTVLTNPLGGKYIKENKLLDIKDCHIDSINNRYNNIGGTCTVLNKQYVIDNYEYVGFESWGVEDNFIRLIEPIFDINNIREFQDKIIHLYHKSFNKSIQGNKTIENITTYNAKLYSYFKSFLYRNHEKILFKNITHNYKDSSLKYLNMITTEGELKYNLGILTYYNFDKSHITSNNLGNYIQSLAVINIYRKMINNYLNTNYNIDDFINVIKKNKLKYFNFVFVSRDNSHQQKFEHDIYLISNGSFLNKSNKCDFPYHKNIKPIFISFHAESENISIETINYLKQYQPIGCRDNETITILNKFGIKTYLSGCITLHIDFYKQTSLKDIIYDDVDNDKVEKVIALFKPKIFDKCIQHNLHNISIQNLNTVCKLLHKYSYATKVITSNINCYTVCIGLNIQCKFISNDLNIKEYKSDDIIKLRNIQTKIINMFFLKVFSLYFKQ